MGAGDVSGNESELQFLLLRLVVRLVASKPLKDGLVSPVIYAA